MTKICAHIHFQDPLTKNWWISFEGHYIGYFPTKLFSNMVGSADKVGFGGRTLTHRGSLSPVMGSRHFPDKNLFHAIFYRLIFIKNASKTNYGHETYRIEKYVDKRKCFDLSYYGNLHRDYGYALQYGGPGGNCGD